MKPIIIKNSRVPDLVSWFMNVAAITIFPFIFISEDYSEDERMIRHETIHFKQYLELLIIGFVVLYLFDFVRGYRKYKNFKDAYTSIRFEQEAYIIESNPDYLETRKFWAWRIYRV